MNFRRACVVVYSQYISNSMVFLKMKEFQMQTEAITRCGRLLFLLLLLLKCITANLIPVQNSTRT